MNWLQNGARLFPVFFPLIPKWPLYSECNAGGFDQCLCCMMLICLDLYSNNGKTFILSIIGIQSQSGFTFWTGFSFPCSNTPGSTHAGLDNGNEWNQVC